MVKKSDAVYYSHPVVVQKSHGQYRVCIDFRPLNICTESASWPLPNIPAIFERIGARQPDDFGVMDLTSGYHQALLTASAKILTAFICFSGIHQFTRLPFGFKRAPSYFQEMMVWPSTYVHRTLRTRLYIIHVPIVYFHPHHLSTGNGRSSASAPL